MPNKKDDREFTLRVPVLFELVYSLDKQGIGLKTDIANIIKFQEANKEFEADEMDLYFGAFNELYDDYYDAAIQMKQSQYKATKMAYNNADNLLKENRVTTYARLVFKRKDCSFFVLSEEEYNMCNEYNRCDN